MVKKCADRSILEVCYHLIACRLLHDPSSYLTGFSIWLLYFVNAFQSSILSNLLPYVTSDFETHSLLNTIYIVADSITAACYVPLSKILDVWGRAEGFLLMTVSATLGLVLMAVCRDLPTFCAAYVSSNCWISLSLIKPQALITGIYRYFTALGLEA